MVHGHEVLQMMEGNSYASTQDIVDAVISKFGPDERYCTCSAEGMTAAELVDLLEANGKFMPAGADGFTVDKTKVCNH